MDNSQFQLVTQTQIDLKVIQGQLDKIESTLIMAWRHFGVAPHMDEKTQQVSHALDALLAVKKSFGLTSEFLPVEEQQHATTTRQVMIPKWIPPEAMKKEEQKKDGQ